MPSDTLTRAHLLLQASRYADAEFALREALAADPDDHVLHALLALALHYQDKTLPARSEAEQAIGLGPDTAFNHYVHAVTLLALDLDHAAQTAVREALRLSPEEPGYYAFQGTLYLRRKAWRQALNVADQGMAQDPGHVGCINVRGQALAKLGRQGEAAATLHEALAQDPENAHTHANMGWTLLDQGDVSGAFPHFREALRIDPMYDWARAGIVEALKARNFLYRLLLRYSLWMSRLTDEEQWQVFGTLSAIRTTLSAGARAFPPLYLVAIPFDLVLFGFRILTWVARPLFALILRLDRFGRQALPREEITASNWLVTCLATSAASVILGLVLREPAFLLLLSVAVLMIVPLAGIFRVPKGWGRTSLAIYTGLMSTAGLIAFGAALIGTGWGWGFAVIPAGIFLLGWTSFFWIAWLILVFSS